MDSPAFRSAGLLSFSCLVKISHVRVKFDKDEAFAVIRAMLVSLETREIPP